MAGLPVVLLDHTRCTQTHNAQTHQQMHTEIHSFFTHESKTFLKTVFM